MQKNIIKSLLFLLVSVFEILSSTAQSPPTRSFSVKEGLPSGTVYDCLEDRNGFMWFATEAGLARFDGFNFKTYTTEDGLSNNTILQLLEDDDGSIWIFPFGRAPCIFDFKEQKIITAKESVLLADLGKYGEHLFAGKTGAGIMLHAEHNLLIIKNRVLTNLGVNIKTYLGPYFYSKDSFCVTIISALSVSAEVRHFSKQKEGWKYQYASGAIFQNKSIHESITLWSQHFWGKYQVFFQQGSFIIYEIKDPTMPLFICKRQIPVKGHINSIHVVGDYLYVCTTAGVLKYDSNFNLVEKTWPEYSMARFFQDRRGNKWFCTLDGRGVFMLQGNGAMIISRAEGLPEENTSTISSGKQGVFLIGDINGNLSRFAWHGGKLVTGNIVRLNSGIRQILNTGDNHIAIADQELALINGNLVRKKKLVSVAYKAATMPDSNTILMGCSSGYFKTDIQLSRIISQSFYNIRFSIISFFADTFYWGNNHGLFYIPGYSKEREDKPDLVKTTAVTEPVTAITCTPDGIVWVGTNTQGVIAYRNKKINATVSLNATGKSGNYLIKRLFAEPDKKRVWAATNRGLQLINYTIIADKVLTRSRLFTSRDGLADDDVNDVLVNGDTVYAATIKGISYFPDGLPATDIPLTISGVTLNYNDTTLSGELEYSINYSRNSFSIHYSGLCYTCDGKIIYKYRLLGPGRDSNWIATPVNAVEFGGLRPGHYVFQVTTDASGIAEITIVIKPTFWQTRWFYILAAFAGLLLLYLAGSWYKQRTERKQQAQIAQNKKFSELELAALQSQMNPHFIFNSMNSLQKFILTKDIHNANEYLAGFSKLLRLFLDASRSRFITISREVELLRLYIELEQMRQMTKFSYDLQVDETISPAMLMPSVIIQPFVENAIVHGLRYLEDSPGWLCIRMMKKGDLFTCIIEDNGVGRKRVKEIQQQKNQQYKSYSTSIIEEKIEALRKMGSTAITVGISDRDAETGMGTVVTIKFKITEENDKDYNNG